VAFNRSLHPRPLSSPGTAGQLGGLIDRLAMSLTRGRPAWPCQAAVAVADDRSGTGAPFPAPQRLGDR
jgi:hypothetical protein